MNTDEDDVRVVDHHEMDEFVGQLQGQVKSNQEWFKETIAEMAEASRRVLEKKIYNLEVRRMV